MSARLFPRSAALTSIFACAVLSSSPASLAQAETPANTRASAQNSISAFIDVDPDEDLTVKPSGANWLTYNGDYTGRRFTSLNQITPENVNQLRAQWVFHTPKSSELEVTPVVVDGIMFVTAANDAYALDARTGRQIWHHAHARHRRPDRRRLTASQSRRRRPGLRRLHGNRQRALGVP